MAEAAARLALVLVNSCGRFREDARMAMVRSWFARGQPRMAPSQTAADDQTALSTILVAAAKAIAANPDPDLGRNPKWTVRLPGCRTTTA